MKCPFGHNELKEVEYLGVSGIYKCTYCNGFWLDSDKLEQIVYRANNVINKSEISLPYIPDIMVYSEKSTEKCPKCSSLLDVKFYDGVLDNVPSVYIRGGPESPGISVIASIFKCNSCNMEWLPGNFIDVYIRKIRLVEIVKKEKRNYQ